MEPISIGAIMICILLLVLIVTGMPIGFTMALCGALGILILSGAGPLFDIISRRVFTESSNYVFTVIPMFVLMGWLAAEGGISTDLFLAAYRWLGRFKGGLAMAVSWACAAFGAVCGCAITTAVTMTSIALPEMRRHMYSDRLATGILASGGNLGMLIPPSIAFIIYGIITETSIGHLFMAGFLPGVLLSSLFCVTIYIICLIDPKAGPPGDKFTFLEKLKLPLGAWLTIVLMLFVLGGIYAGIFTPTEAGAVGAFGALVLGVASRRLKWKGFVAALVKTISTSGMILILIIGANIFSAMLALSTLPFGMVNFIMGFAINKWVILIAILILYIILGFFLDIMSILLILLPITSPILKALGFDPVWIGVLTTITVLMGQISPPVGIVVYAVAGAVREVPMSTIFRGAMPFFVAMFVCLIILIIFPEISLFIPATMYGR